MLRFCYWSKQACSYLFHINVLSERHLKSWNCSCFSRLLMFASSAPCLVSKCNCYAKGLFFPLYHSFCCKMVTSKFLNCQNLKVFKNYCKSETFALKSRIFEFATFVVAKPSALLTSVIQVFDIYSKGPSKPLQKFECY